MKALVIILAAVLVLAHPAAAVAVFGTELAACAVLGALIWRASRFRSCPHQRWAA
jgi:hypothetical protein